MCLTFSFYFRKPNKNVVTLGPLCNKTTASMQRSQVKILHSRHGISRQVGAYWYRHSIQKNVSPSLVLPSSVAWFSIFLNISLLAAMGCLLYFQVCPLSSRHDFSQRNHKSWDFGWPMISLWIILARSREGRLTLQVLKHHRRYQKRSLKDFQRNYAACQHDDDNDGDCNYDKVYILLQYCCIHMRWSSKEFGDSHSWQTFMLTSQHGKTQPTSPRGVETHCNTKILQIRRAKDPKQFRHTLEIYIYIYMCLQSMY